MKRILLVTSLLSFAAQIPVQAQPKFVAKIISPKNQHMLRHSAKTLAKDVKVLAAQSAVAAQDAFNRAEEAARPVVISLAKIVKREAHRAENIAKPLVAKTATIIKKSCDYYVHGVNSVGNGFKHIFTHYPALSAISLFGISGASFHKSIKPDTKSENRPFFATVGLSAAVLGSIAAANVVQQYAK